MLKVKIDYKSFIRRGLKSRNEDFEVALITGYMGSGKSYLGVYMTEQTKRNVFTNMKTYKSPSRQINYFTERNEIYMNDDKDMLFLIDECSKWFPKDARVDEKFYEWLQHSRKSNRYVYLIFQEYLMIPTWIRGVATRVYTTRKVPLVHVCLTSYGIPVLDSETKEWGLQELALIIYKRNKRIAELYDTDETIL